MNRESLQSLILAACSIDIRAFKPGNVSIGYPMHDMESEDFIRSAEAILDPITAPRSSVGERIESSIIATRSRVHCNTNLGIVLLIAPIAKAVEDIDGPLSREPLEDALRRTLRGLTLADSEACFRAIRQAQPSGLGASDQEDVTAPPTESLLEVMGHADDRDQIAKAYTSGYQDIWLRGVDRLAQFYSSGRSELSAVTQLYLEFVAYEPDTHLKRRHGLELARSIQQEFQECLLELESCGNATSRWFLLKKLDSKLKSQKFNPGTSADMTIASVLLLHLLQHDGYNARRQLPLGQRFSAESF